MSLFHRHRWEEVGRINVVSRVTSSQGFKGDRVTGLALLNGFTRVELHCKYKECGEVTYRILPGAQS